jgi:hypothetical protein
VERAELLLAGLGIDDARDDPRVSLGHAVDDRGHEPRHQRFRTADPHLSGTGIGQELDISNPLFELVEDHVATIEQGPRVDRRLDALGAAVEKPHPQRVLQVGDRFGNGRLGHAELSGALGHAAALGDRGKDVEIAQFEPPADAALPVSLSADHRFYLLGYPLKRHSPFSTSGLGWLLLPSWRIHGMPAQGCRRKGEPA